VGEGSTEFLTSAVGLSVRTIAHPRRPTTSVVGLTALSGTWFPVGRQRVRESRQAASEPSRPVRGPLDLGEGTDS